MPLRLTLPMVTPVPVTPSRWMPSPVPPSPAVTEVRFAWNAVGLMKIAVPLFEVIWLSLSGLRMLTVPEDCARKPNASVPLTVMSTPPLKLNVLSAVLLVCRSTPWPLAPRRR